MTSISADITSFDKNGTLFGTINIIITSRGIGGIIIITFLILKGGGAV